MKALLALLLFATVAHAEPTIRRIDETLPNGLRVIVAPDPTVNSIAVHVRYRGGYTEDANTVVLDQLFANAEHDARLDAIGGYAVSNFEAHHMEVFEVVPSGALELALWSQTKRMTMDVTNIDAAKTAAKAAYESAGEFAAVDLTIEKLLWPTRGDRRGTPKQIGAATLDSIRTLAKERLSPSNATLVIAGRVDVQAALSAVRKYFGALPARELATVYFDQGTSAGPQSATAPGIERMRIHAVAMPLGPGLVLEQLLETAGVTVEARNDHVRITDEDPDPMSKVWLAVLKASEEQLAVARRRAHTKLLLKLESLPYRTRLLANDVDIDRLRASITSINRDDLRDLAVTLRSSVTVEVVVP